MPVSIITPRKNKWDEESVKSRFKRMLKTRKFAFQFWKGKQVFKIFELVFLFQNKGITPNIKTSR